MTSKNGEEPSHERTPQKLVYEAHKQAAEERERVNAAPYVPDSAVNTQFAEVEYHAAVLEYFNRLKPHLPDRPEYWDRVPLWNEPLEGKRDELAGRFAEYYGVEKHQAIALFDALERNENFPAIQPRTDSTVRGLKNLVHWRGRTETETRTKNDVLAGEVRETVERPMHLPREVAMRAHDALDAAASDLGYNTRPGKDITKSRLKGDASEYTVEGVVNDE